MHQKLEWWIFSWDNSRYWAPDWRVTLFQPWILEDKFLGPEDLPPAVLWVLNVAVVVEDADRLPGQLQEGVFHLGKGYRSKDVSN